MSRSEMPNMLSVGKLLATFSAVCCLLCMPANAAEDPSPEDEATAKVVPADADTSSGQEEDDAVTIPRAAVESRSLRASCDLGAYGIAEPKMVPPIVYVKDFGAKGDGVTDDSAAINKAIQSLSRGGTVVFEEGRTYLKRKKIVVDKPGVRLWGYGATIFAYITKKEISAHQRDHARQEAQVSIQLLAPKTGVYGLTIVSNMRVRITGTAGTAGIHMAADDQQAIDNRFEYTLNGVRVRGAKSAKNFVIARNVAYRTTADAFTVMANSWDGRILCNVVRENGDDMVSVLDFGLGEPDALARVLVEGNDLGSTYWGRGIAVHGGRDVTIRNNSIAATTHAAGILIRGGKDSYKMANVRNVVVENNKIAEVQTTEPGYNPVPNWKRTKQAAIDIRGYGEVSDVLVRGNTIAGAAFDGILVKGHANNIGLIGNRLSGIRGRPIKIEDVDGTVACADNTNDNSPIEYGKCGGEMPVVRGAGM
jgi:pectate lyase-like protein